jgi:hypothetical protein
VVPIHRFDINFDGIVSGPDLLKFGPVFGATCPLIDPLPFQQ